MSMHRRIRRLEDQAPRQPSSSELQAQRQHHRQALARLDARCEEDADPTARRAAVADLRQYLQERGRL